MTRPESLAASDQARLTAILSSWPELAAVQAHIDEVHLAPDRPFVSLKPGYVGIDHPLFITAYTATLAGSSRSGRDHRCTRQERMLPSMTFHVM
jgi:hypothetical protein